MSTEVKQRGHDTKPFATALNGFLNDVQDLRHVGIHGWKRPVANDHNKKERPGLNYDPKAIQFAQQIEAMSAEFMAIQSAKIREFLNNRDIEVNGCRQPDDCRTYAAGQQGCGHLQASGGCQLGRR